MCVHAVVFDFFFFLTFQENEGQIKKLSQIQQSLKNYNIELEIEYSTTLHDRQIKLVYKKLISQS